MTVTEEEVAKLRIDPRIRERRNEVARSIGRRRLYIILAAFTFFACLGLARVILRTSLFSVSTINVSGGVDYPGSVIVDASGIRKGTSLTQINPTQAIARISALPFVSSVTVKKKWPNTVDIAVQGRTPLAVVPTDLNNVLVVDATGRVLEDQGSASVTNLIKICRFSSVSSSKALANLNGCAQQSVKPGAKLPSGYTSLLKVTAAIHANNAAGFAMLAESPNGEVDGLLTSGTAVRFGSAYNLAEKLRSVELVLSQASTSGYTTIDVRVPGEPVLSNW